MSAHVHVLRYACLRRCACVCLCTWLCVCENMCVSVHVYTCAGIRVCGHRPGQGHIQGAGLLPWISCIFLRYFSPLALSLKAAEILEYGFCFSFPHKSIGKMACPSSPLSLTPSSSLPSLSALPPSHPISLPAPISFLWVPGSWSD